MSNSNTSPLQIGFDRFIPLAWAACAIKVRAGRASSDALDALLEDAGQGKASKTKNRTVLKGMWLEPRAGLEPFADRGLGIWKGSEKTPVVPLSWGMAITAYPFFGKVVETIGRLTGLQGECTTTEVHRRIAEIYGQRETTTRAVNRVIQTLVDWDVIERPDKGRSLVRRAPAPIGDEGLTGWLIEAAVRYSGKALPLSTLPSSAVLFPFVLQGSLALVASRCAALELHSEGARVQMVSVREPG